MRHWSPTQQPLQLEASHLPTLHERWIGSHARPCSEQSVHAAPERPQAFGSLPARQIEVPPVKLQHPPEHVEAPQFVTVRAQTLPFGTSQVWKPFAMQSEQRWPVDPHARVSAPVRQMPLPSQQPLGQFDGPQLPTGTPPSAGVSSSRLDRPQPGATRTRNTATSAAKTAAAAGERRDEEEDTRIREAFRIQRIVAERRRCR
jgi:hypothetical protein